MEDVVMAAAGNNSTALMASLLDRREYQSNITGDILRAVGSHIAGEIMTSLLAQEQDNVSFEWISPKRFRFRDLMSNWRYIPVPERNLLLWAWPMVGIG
jgi:hypothetical protein